MNYVVAIHDDILHFMIILELINSLMTQMSDFLSLAENHLLKSEKIVILKKFRFIYLTFLFTKSEGPHLS